MSVVTAHEAAAFQERIKLLTGWLIHMNTLCAGSIVVIGSFAGRTRPSGGVWAGLAMAAFGVAIVCGLLAHFLIALEIGAQVPGEELPSMQPENVLTVALIMVAIAFFVLALVFLIVFGFMNLT